MELINDALQPSMEAPAAPAAEVRRARVAVDDATLTRELARYADALGPGLTMSMMMSTALLIGSGVAAQWAAPTFDWLPTALAVGCLATALGLSLGARARFRARVERCGVALGLTEADARARAKALLSRWFADGREG